MAHMSKRQWTDRWKESHERFSTGPFPCDPRTKPISKIIKTSHWITVSSPTISAINYLCLDWVQFKLASQKPILQRVFDSTRFMFRVAMNKQVVRISTPRNIWISLCYPNIERVVQEQISENWTHYSALWGNAGSLSARAALIAQDARKLRCSHADLH